MLTSDKAGGQHTVSSKFQVADVTRALWSVGVICDCGVGVVFKADQAITKQDGTEICVFQRKNGLYVARVKLRNLAFQQGFQRPGK